MSELNKNNSVENLLQSFELLLLRFSKPREYVVFYLKSHNLQFSSSGEIVDQNHNSVQTAIEDMWLDYRIDFREALARLKAYDKQEGTSLHKKLYRFKPKELEQALTSVSFKKRDEYRLNLFKEIQHDDSELSELERLSSLIVTKGKVEDTKKILAHWIWCIKRKIKDLPTEYEIMPIFYGMQGCGKSELVRKLTSPLRNTVLEMDIENALESHQSFAFETSFACIFDELRGASKADINRLKTLITNKKTTARKMYTQLVSTQNQRCSFIATTNYPVNEQIYDTSGNRRFIEIAFRKDAKKYFDDINKIDFLKIFKSVDENKEDGYIRDLIEKIILSNDTPENKEPVDQFLDDYDIRTSYLYDNEIVAKEVLYRIYTNYCDINNLPCLQAPTFVRKLKNREIDSSFDRKGGKRNVYFHIYNESAVMQEIVKDRKNNNVLRLKKV